MGLGIPCIPLFALQCLVVTQITCSAYLMQPLLGACTTVMHIPYASEVFPDVMPLWASIFVASTHGRAKQEGLTGFLSILFK